jgi:predicted nucleic acid-binding protein
VTTLFDTGPLVAAIDRSDKHHLRCAAFLETAPHPFLVPTTSSSRSVYASVIAISERLKLKDVATLNRKHFSVVRPNHVDALNLLP